MYQRTSSFRRSFANGDREVWDEAVREACAEVGLIGQSPAFWAVLAQLPKVAAADAPVLLKGATGTGKELIARAIHYLSPRHGRPFVPVNCGALPDTLFESELFGHVKGAFTDARHDRQGLVAVAAEGTLFLDEIDSLSPRAQVALLRFLQDREYRPVGSGRTCHAALRVLAATNVDIEDLAARKQFREDLVFRLDVLSLALPSLAERPEDIAVLARHFAARYAQRYARTVPMIEAPTLAWLQQQHWPGNVRQLESVMHRAVLLGEEGEIALPSSSAPGGSGETRPELYDGGLRAACTRARWETEDRYLRGLLALTGGNVSEAARRAGTERRAMGRLLKKHGLASHKPARDSSRLNF